MFVSRLYLSHTLLHVLIIDENVWISTIAQNMHVKLNHTKTISILNKWICKFKSWFFKVEFVLKTHRTQSRRRDRKNSSSILNFFSACRRSWSIAAKCYSTHTQRKLDVIYRSTWNNSKRTLFRTQSISSKFYKRCPIYGEFQEHATILLYLLKYYIILSPHLKCAAKVKLITRLYALLVHTISNSFIRQAIQYMQ